VLGQHGATPGFLPGPIPAGEWVAEIDCHCVLDSAEGGVRCALTVESVAADRTDGVWNGPVAAVLAAGHVTQAAPAEGTAGSAAIPEYEPASHVTPRPPVDAARPRWLKGDLHVHSQHSDGRWSMDEIARYVEQNQLDFIAVTDHNTTSAYEDVRLTLERAGLGAVVVIPAMELTTFWGHANALGVCDWIDWRVRGPEGLPATIGQAPDAAPTSTMEVAAAAVHRLGGTFVVNHPRSSGYPACTGCRWELGDASAGYADAIEVWNGPWDRVQNHQGMKVWDRWLNAGRRIPATAGTDSHEWPHKPQQQGYTHVWSRPRVEDILAAVRAGRSYLSCGPSIKWQGRPPSDEWLAVEIGRLADPAQLRIVHNGRVITTEPIDGDTQIAAELPDRAERAGWYRAELWRRHSTMLLATTNPLWLD
jgi:predicted metal-dependent phosphoesterase TrpH